MTKDSSLAPSLVASTFIHLAALGAASALIGQRNHFPEQNLISVALLDPIQDNKIIRPRTEDAIKPEPPKQPSARRKRETIRAEPSPPRTTKDDISKPDESKTSPPPAAASPETSRVEGGGSASGVSNLAAGDFGVAPGSGNAGSGAGTAIAGLGRGSGAPGLPAPTPPVRTNREATPIQTVRPSYPPMALRMRMESDVTLRIEVDPAGKVTRAEIIKTGGAGFDEEALKAVTQSRFEPAQKDGQNVAAEFSYIYRFRLQR
jgi:TonB family protein